MAKENNISSNPASIQPIFNFPLRAKYILLALTGLIFYANTLNNKYAFDDEMAIEKNAYVQMGFSGIPKILTNDSWASFHNYWNVEDLSGQLSGGRYRPLSEVIFAIEQQLFGDSNLLPYYRHFVNIAAFAACIIAIFYFLENFLFKKISGGSDVAFLSTFLFAIHPLHTEVVANIKSLDEILSLLFIILTFIFSLKYLQEKRIKHLIYGAVSFFLALLSKEYAVTLLFFIPFLFYLLENKKPLPAIIASVPYYGVFGLYLIMRYYAVGFHSSQSNSILINAYLYATHTQKIATEWLVLGKYLRLLFLPYPLAYDYSYKQIPYRSFWDISVILSILIYGAILAWGIILTLKKNVLSFAFLFFLANILLVSNFVVDIGAPMGERLVFHSSLGFVIILSYYFIQAISKMRTRFKKGIVIAIMSVIGALCFGETVVRNVQWKDDNSLFIHDVYVVPNSCVANSNAGWSYSELSKKKEYGADRAKAYLDSAYKFLWRAIRINPNYYIAYNDLGAVYYYKGLFDSSKYCFDMVENLYPGYPGLKSNYGVLSQHYFTEGINLAMRENKPHEGIMEMRKALSIDSTNAHIWYNMAIAYHQLQQYDSTKYALMKTLQYKPDKSDSLNAERDLQELLQISPGQAGIKQP